MGTVSWQDIYQGMPAPGVETTAPSTMALASGPVLASPAQSPAMALIVIVLLLVALRVGYDMLPSGGKGI